MSLQVAGESLLAEDIKKRYIEKSVAVRDISGVALTGRTGSGCHYQRPKSGEQSKKVEVFVHRE